MSDPQARPTLAYATPVHLAGNSFVVRSRYGIAGRILLVAVILLSACLLLVSWRSTPDGACWTTLLLLAAAFVSIDRYLADRSPDLVLGDTTFLSTIGNRMEIRWSDIARAQTVHHDEGTYLILSLVDPAAAPQPPTLYNRPTFDRPPEATDEDILVPISGLDASPDLILREIHTRIAAAAHAKPA
jgi:hypothetical protein